MMTPKTLSVATITASIVALSVPALASMHPDDTSPRFSYASAAIDPRTLSAEDFQYAPALSGREMKAETKADPDHSNNGPEAAYDNSHLETKQVHRMPVAHVAFPSELINLQFSFLDEGSKEKMLTTG